MEPETLRTNGENFVLHVYQTEDKEVLDRHKIKTVLKGLEIEAYITISKYNKIHLVIVTQNNPSPEKIKKMCEKIEKL